jgi:hypothetical protein
MVAYPEGVRGEDWKEFFPLTVACDLQAEYFPGARDDRDVERRTARRGTPTSCVITSTSMAPEEIHGWSARGGAHPAEMERIKYQAGHNGDCATFSMLCAPTDSITPTAELLAGYRRCVACRCRIAAAVRRQAQGWVRDSRRRGVPRACGGRGFLRAAECGREARGHLLCEHLRSAVATEILDGGAVPARGRPGTSLSGSWHEATGLRCRRFAWDTLRRGWHCMRSPRRISVIHGRLQRRADDRM